MDNTNEAHTHGDDQRLCMMCRMNESMHGHGCSRCHGMNHYGLVRIILALAILGFVFWAGVCVGGMINDDGFSRHHRMGGHGYGNDGEMPNMMYSVSAQAIPAMPAQLQTGTVTVPAPVR